MDAFSSGTSIHIEMKWTTVVSVHNDIVVFR